MKYISAITVCCTLASCATDSNLSRNAQAERYRGENGIAFTVEVANDSDTVNGNRSYGVLYRTAGSLSPGQTVLSTPECAPNLAWAAS